MAKLRYGEIQLLRNWHIVDRLGNGLTMCDQTINPKAELMFVGQGDAILTYCPICVKRLLERVGGNGK